MSEFSFLENNSFNIILYYLYILSECLLIQKNMLAIIIFTFLGLYMSELRINDVMLQ